MAYIETFWMACDSTEQLRAEFGPFHGRAEAETEAARLGFGYLLRYEHVLSDKDEIQEVRCVFIELQVSPVTVAACLEDCILAVRLAEFLRCTRKPGEPKCGQIFMNSRIHGIASGFSSRPHIR